MSASVTFGTGRHAGTCSGWLARTRPDPVSEPCPRLHTQRAVSPSELLHADNTAFNSQRKQNIRPNSPKYSTTHRKVLNIIKQKIDKFNVRAYSRVGLQSTALSDERTRKREQSYRVQCDGEETDLLGPWRVGR